MPVSTLLVISELSFDLGLIGIDEYHERLAVVNWLFGDDDATVDPRIELSEYSNGEAPNFPENAGSTVGKTRRTHARVGDDTIYFLFQKRWYFTRSDPDSYPSIPHGHLTSPDKPWPKLNPYTGRAFRTKHQENPRLRLNKTDMRLLWQDEKFREFCRGHIVWYMEQYPFYEFRVRRPLRLPRW
jgi:hypothetical protein